MIKITTIIDWDTPFVYSTLGWAVQGLTSYLNCEVQTYSYNELKARQIEKDNDCDFLIFEIGNPQHAGWTTLQLRERFPSAKFICFCSDTIYYQVNNLGWQMDPNGIDLHLEVMPQSVEYFLNNKIEAELWHWTVSKKLINLVLEFLMTNLNIQHEYDFIGVYHPGTISNPESYRHHLVKFLTENGKTFTQGGGNGHQDNDFNRLFTHYRKSKWTLGTTSHMRPELTKLGCMKGFRDWIGPLLGAPLIYDNHPNIDTFKNVTIPRYDYYNFESIIQLIDNYSDDVYRQLIMNQIGWVYKNTIEIQLVKSLYKRHWINTQDIIRHGII